MPKPVCVKCGLFFKPKKIGVYWEEGRPLDRENKEWGPYKIWVSDLYECRGCGQQILTGTGIGPVKEHYEKDYKDLAAKTNLLVFVADC